MTTPIKIDFVSDVSCPWCIIGLKGLETALERLGDTVDARITFQPFELNPNMPAGGQNMVEHVLEKYGTSAEEQVGNREKIRDRAAAVGFTMKRSDQSRIYNSFDAHRLLHWAELEGRQSELKHGLFTAYFTEEKDPSDADVLVEAAAKAGLDRDKAREVLDTGRYAEEVREAEHLWQSRGISAVPAVVINERYLISGGQPAEAFEQALRDIAAEAAAEA